MTVDSFYFPETKLPDNEVEYPFEIESVGAEAFQVYLVTPDGDLILIPQYVEP